MQTQFLAITIAIAARSVVQFLSQNLNYRNLRSSIVSPYPKSTSPSPKINIGNTTWWKKGWESNLFKMFYEDNNGYTIIGSPVIASTSSSFLHVVIINIFLDLD